jgi:hypothetical protein
MLSGGSEGACRKAALSCFDFVMEESKRKMLE